MYNALRKESHRRSFAAGNQNTPHFNFVRYIADQGTENKEALEKRLRIDGYNSMDMMRYLGYLKRSKHIKSYTWKRCADKWTPINILTSKLTEPKIHVVFGNAVKTDRRLSHNPKKNPILRAASSMRMKGDRNIALQHREYSKWSEAYYAKGAKRDLYTHAISLGRSTTDNDTAYIYDTALPKRKLHTMNNYAFSIAWHFNAYQFDIEPY
jgi:hypothetical protein